MNGQRLSVAKESGPFPGPKRVDRLAQCRGHEDACKVSKQSYILLWWALHAAAVLVFLMIVTTNVYKMCQLVCTHASLEKTGG